jgi:hypothetical protein
VKEQYACGGGDCQRERHRRNCAQWNAAHRDQFLDRYPQTRAWLEEHPGYLARYRTDRPEVREEHRRAEQDRRRRRRDAAVDIQDAISIQTLEGKEVGIDYGRVDIQDAIWRYLFVLIGLVANKGRLDIQDETDSRALPLYASGREIWRWAHRERAEKAG